MADTRHVKGLAELQKFLDQVPVKLERNIMRGALRAGMNVVKPAAQSNINSVSGQLARGLKVGTRVIYGRVIARLRTTGPHAFLARMIEFTGAAAHIIRARTRLALAFGRTVVREVKHPGFQPKPFMRPALDTMASPAAIAVGNYVKQRLTKAGLNASHVTVEGDEE